MGGLFGVVSKEDSVLDLFYGTDYHSHLGTRRGGMAVWNTLLDYWRYEHRAHGSVEQQGLYTFHPQH